MYFPTEADVSDHVPTGLAVLGPLEMLTFRSLHTQQKMVLMICSFEHVQGVLCTDILTAILQQQMEAKGVYIS